MRRSLNSQKSFLYFCLTFVLGCATIFVVKKKQDSGQQQQIPQKQQTPGTNLGNTKIRNFRTAKKLAKQFYQHQNFKTIYLPQFTNYQFHFSSD